MTGSKSKNKKLNKNNRWRYSTKSERRGFVSAMYIISIAAVLQLFLYDILPGTIYGFIYGFLFFIEGLFAPEFLYSLNPEEIHHMTGSAVMVLSSAAASLATGAFIILCMKKFVLKPGAGDTAKTNRQDEDRVRIKKFKLPKNTPALIAVGLCISQLSVFVYIALNYFLYSVFGVASHIHSDIDMYLPQTAAGAIMFFMASVIAPSIFEEFIFRYAMLNSLRKYGDIFAVAATSVLFGFAHARMSAFIYATAVGAFSAYIALKTKSIWFSIILHAAVNGVAFVMQYLSAAFTWDSALPDIIYFAYLSFISAVSLIYLIIYIIKRRNAGPAPPKKRVYISNGRKLLLFFNAASLIFFVLVILRSAEEYGFLCI